MKGHLWHFAIRWRAEPDQFITVATTRPETMLGDTAVAVHPEDERYKDLVGTHAVLPLVGRRIPIVADEYADPETGSGAVKITPAHDFNDFEVGRRNKLEMINVLDRDAQIIDDATFRKPIAAWTATRRASASSPTWKSRGWSRRSSRTPTCCPTATAPAWSSSPG